MAGIETGFLSEKGRSPVVPDFSQCFYLHRIIYLPCILRTNDGIKRSEETRI